ncbi:MAG: right-handed parallel beta-helix repeat-containing protein [Phycisphaeraceae bacterium]
MIIRLLSTVALALGWAAATAKAQTIWYVDDDGDPGNGCTSWADACTELQTALSLTGLDDEIWVAAGTYLPDFDVGAGQHSGDRQATFQLISGVGIYGGFDGTEGNLEDRAGLFDQTILSGDLASNDGPHFARNMENSFHVVTADQVDRSAVLDGFTIEGGNAQGFDGAGLLCLAASPTLIDCTFTRCEAAGGGAVYITGEIIVGEKTLQLPTAPSLAGCQFAGNRASQGGALYSNLASPDMANCRFDGNEAQFRGGGATLRFGSIGGETSRLFNCVFTGNIADWGGGLNVYGVESQLVNCVFSGNLAHNRGGAVRAGLIFFAPDYFTMVNCTLANNSAGQFVGGVYSGSSQGLTLSNCVLWGNVDGEKWDIQSSQLFGGSPIINYSCVEGWTGGLGGAGNIGQDPLLVDVDGPDAVLGTADDDLRLRPASACIDAGDSMAVPADVLDLDGNGDTSEPVPFDAEGMPRFLDDPSVVDTGVPLPQGAVVDMGAYEDAKQAFVIDGDTPLVPEGGTAVFTVALARDPGGLLPATVARVGGDADIDVLGQTVLLFDSSNFSMPQAVTLAAAPDPDFTAGAALIWVTAQATATADVTATEDDSDPVPGRVYVNAAASGLDTGISWPDAFVELRDAFGAAAGNPGVGEMWVAAGTYKAAGPGGERSATFRLRDGLVVLGGFAGEEASAQHRDPATHETVLTGDLDGDDPPFSDCCFSNDTPGCDNAGCTAAVCDQDPFCCQVSWDVLCALQAGAACPEVCWLRSDNSFHVVTTSGTDRSAVLDGFTIADGYADENLNGNKRGAGVLNVAGSPALVRCTLKHNIANFGGGMYSFTNSEPLLVNCRFTSNVGDAGGGMAAGYFGGAIANSHPVLVNCSFILNYSSGAALGSPALGNGGGMWAHGAATLVNCTFYGNHGISTGGLWNESTPGANPALDNCIFWANLAGGAMDQSAQLDSFVSSVAVNHSCIQGWTGSLGGTGNIGADPQLLDPSGPDSILGTADDNLRLSSGSPCIDAADNTAVPADSPDLDGDGDTEEPIPSDLDNTPRFVDDPQTTDTGFGEPPIVDMGVYEFCLGDLNHDGVVDAADLAQLLGAWGANPGNPADINGDDAVDAADLALLLGAWGPCS